MESRAVNKSLALTSADELAPRFTILSNRDRSLTRLGPPPPPAPTPATPAPTAGYPNSSDEFGLALRRVTALELSIPLWNRPNLERSTDVFASISMPEGDVAPGSDERGVGGGW